MKHWFDYKLLDFGDGRKLERLGELCVDRPCPAAESMPKGCLDLWREVQGRYEGRRAGEGQWKSTAQKPKADEQQIGFSFEGLSGATSKHCDFKLRVAPSPAGQVGVFPEQCTNWQWIAEQVWRRGGESLKVLNLFAYSGASTLAAAAAGASVTHVDAAKQAVHLARRNADASNLADRPIRWIVDDAMKFCQREVRRGNRYDAVILDPPSYGHGPKGEAWSIRRDLLSLLELCGQLTERRPKFLLLTCHSPDIGPAELSAYLSDGVFGSCSQPPSSGQLHITATDGRQLPSGTFARWPK